MKIGWVRRAHGIKGAVIVRVLDEEQGQFRADRVLTTDNAGYPELTVVAANPHRDGMLVSFSEISDRNEAETVRGTSLLIDPGERRALDDDEYRAEQLIGLEVVDVGGERLGSIADLVSGLAQDRLVVATPSGERREVPFVAAIVTSVDVERQRVVIDPPEGLF